jgi:hypothetical protein
MNWVTSVTTTYNGKFKAFNGMYFQSPLSDKLSLLFRKYDLAFYFAKPLRGVHVTFRT